MKPDGSFSGETNGLKIPMTPSKNNPVCCKNCNGEGIVERGCISPKFCPCHTKTHDKNGHKIDLEGKLVFDEECHGCDAPKTTAPEQDESRNRVVDDARFFEFGMKSTTPDAWEAELVSEVMFLIGTENFYPTLKSFIGAKLAQARAERDAFWEAQEMGVASDCAEHERKARADTVAEVLAALPKDLERYPTTQPLSYHKGFNVALGMARTAISRLVDREEMV